MGVDFNAGIFYGAKVNLGDRDEWDFPDEFNESSQFLEIPLEIGNINPYGEPLHIMYVRSTWKMTDDTSEQMFIKFKDLSQDTDNWDTLIELACNKHGLDFSPPDWHFVSYYS